MGTSLSNYFLILLQSHHRLNLKTTGFSPPHERKRRLPSFLVELFESNSGWPDNIQISIAA
eukprot:m.38644 g.38644  ORF g.38644 m.38644 type:complete len:61 (+) comp6812_c3_seq3:1129-1311(+)